LWAGIDIAPEQGSGRAVCERLVARGVLAKDTHGQTLRLAPPLVTTEAQIHQIVDALSGALTGV
jgi:acetylornithine/succinyldiaminopimelate/putrescine aminotransferase